MIRFSSPVTHTLVNTESIIGERLFTLSCRATTNGWVEVECFDAVVRLARVPRAEDGTRVPPRVRYCTRARGRLGAVPRTWGLGLSTCA